MDATLLLHCSSKRVIVPGGQTSGVVCLVLTFIAVAMCGIVVTVCISRWSKKRHSSEAAPNTQELQVDPAYVEVDTLQSQTIRLEENVAYGPVKQGQNIELKENVAYGPVKQGQNIELKENVAYGPVKQGQDIELKENVAYGPVKRN